MKGRRNSEVRQLQQRVQKLYRLWFIFLSQIFLSNFFNRSSHDLSQRHQAALIFP